MHQLRDYLFRIHRHGEPTGLSGPVRARDKADAAAHVIATIGAEALTRAWIDGTVTVEVTDAAA